MIDLDEIIEEQTGEEISLMNSGHVQGIRDCMKEVARQALREYKTNVKNEFCLGYHPEEDVYEWDMPGIERVDKAKIPELK